MREQLTKLERAWNVWRNHPSVCDGDVTSSDTWKRDLDVAIGESLQTYVAQVQFNEQELDSAFARYSESPSLDMALAVLLAAGAVCGLNKAVETADLLQDERVRTVLHYFASKNERLGYQVETIDRLESEIEHQRRRAATFEQMLMTLGTAVNKSSDQLIRNLESAWDNLPVTGDSFGNNELSALGKAIEAVSGAHWDSVAATLTKTDNLVIQRIGVSASIDLIAELTLFRNAYLPLTARDLPPTEKMYRSGQYVILTIRDKAGRLLGLLECKLATPTGSAFAPYWNLETLVVNTAYREMGLARRLLMHFLDVAPTLATMTVHFRQSSKDQLELIYGKLGFQDCTVDGVYKGNGETRYKMTRTVEYWLPYEQSGESK